MKILIGILATALSFSAYGITIVNNYRGWTEKVHIKNIGANNGYETWVNFRSYHDGMLETDGIPQMSATIEKTDGGDSTYVVYAPNYSAVNNVTVSAWGCEIMLNKTTNGPDSAVLSDQC